MYVRAVLAYAGFAVVMLGAPAASATLIGDTVDLETNGSFDTIVEFMDTTIPDSGDVDLTFTGPVSGLGDPEVTETIFGAGSGVSMADVTIDLGADEIFITVEALRDLIIGQVFFEFNSLDWVGHPDADLTDVTVATAGPVSVLPVIPEDHSFTSDASFLSLPSGTTAEIQYQLFTDHTETPVVPEPTTVGLIGMGLAGVAWRARKRFA